MILEGMLEREEKHLIKTDTIFNMCSHHIDLQDDSREREELLEIGMRQVIQSRLYAHNYFSVQMGYFVNVDKCENLWYLKMIIDGKDTVISGKVAARNRIKELKALDGELIMIPDENGVMIVTETKTKEEIMADLEADAI
jgi:hypothetical protein